MGVPRTAWLLAALVVGTVTAADPGGWSPFGPAKWLVVSVVGTALIGSSFTYVRRLERREQVVLAGFLGLVVVAAAFGQDGRYAWLGTPERHLGVATWVIVGGTYVAGRSIEAERARLVVGRAAVLAAGVVATWSAVELAFGPPIELVTTTDRLTGPFGSAAFLGASALLFGLVAAGVALDATERIGWRVAAGLGAFGCAIALVGSGARAAWVGAAVGAVVLGRRHVRWIAVGLVVALLACVPRLDVLDRSAGAGSRLDEWRVAARVVVGHPFAGVGPEGYRIAFSEGVDDDYERAHGRSVLPDRAHSAPLDVAVTAGLPAAVLWLVAVGFTVRRSWVAARSGSALALGLGAACAAFFTQQLLLFPTMELDPVAWAFAGILVSLTDPLAGAGAAADPPPLVGRVGWVGLVAAATVVVAVLVGVAGVREVAADRLARRSLDALVSSDVPAAVGHARRAVDLRGDVLRYRLLLARAEEADGSVASIERALDQVAAARSVSSGDPVVRGEEARLLSVRAAISGDPAQLRAAFDAFAALVADDPHQAEWQFGLGLAAAAIGDRARAETALERAAYLAPDDPRPAEALSRLRSTDGMAG